MRCFNSRTREGCDFIFSVARGVAKEFQFTHPGGVRHNRLLLLIVSTSVSIHAPGRGATVWCKVAYYGADKQA